jgi:uncharacterized PurR-regulated membrane protein YhhQ (DUF165 family)
MTSSCVAALIDSSLFVTIAFIGEPVPWVTWGIGDFAVKCCMALMMLVPFRAATRGLPLQGNLPL